MFHGDMYPLFSERPPPPVVNHTTGVFDRHFNPLLSRGATSTLGNFAHRRISQPRKSERIRNLEVRIPIWVFPKIGIPPNHPFLIGFSIINHPFWGTPIFGNTHMVSCFLQQDLLICMIHMYQCNIPYDNGYFLFQHDFLIFMTHTYYNARLHPYDVWFNIVCFPCICIQKYAAKQVQELQRNTFLG